MSIEVIVEPTSTSSLLLIVRDVFEASNSNRSPPIGESPIKKFTPPRSNVYVPTGYWDPSIPIVPMGVLSGRFSMS